MLKKQYLRGCCPNGNPFERSLYLSLSKAKERFLPTNLDGLVKSRIFEFIWIPAYAGMTIKQLISIRYTIRHTRECGYPCAKMTFYEFINLGEAEDK